MSTSSPVPAAPLSRRSCLSVPGSSEKMLAKAPGLAADEVVIDLEDAVSVAAKDAARELTVATLTSWSGPTVAVRVNAPRTPWCHLDLAALGALERPPASVVVPKVESAGDLAFVERLLDGVEAARGASATSGAAGRIRIQALVETAAGLARIAEIAAASERLDTLILGYADLGASLGGARALDAWLPAQHAVVVAARANGVQAIDGPYLGIQADDGFHAATGRAAELGFDGKWAIHPSQLAALNTAFSPTAAEVQRARAIVDALDRAAAAGDGAVSLDGEMLDEAVRVAALRVLARAGAAEVAS